LYDYILNCIW